MRRLAVVAEALAVVGGEHDEGVAVLPAGEERLEEGRERGVGRGHLAVVGARHAAAPVEGRRVGRVGLVEVDPAEPGPGVAWSQARAAATVSGPARSCIWKSGPRRGVAEPVVVDLEAAVEAEAGVEGKGADERAGAVALAAQQRGQRVQPGGKRKPELSRTPWSKG